MEDKEEDPILFDEKSHIDVGEINFPETENWAYYKKLTIIFTSLERRPYRWRYIVDLHWSLSGWGFLGNGWWNYW